MFRGEIAKKDERGALSEDEDLHSTAQSIRTVLQFPHTAGTHISNSSFVSEVEVSVSTKADNC